MQWNSAGLTGDRLRSRAAIGVARKRLDVLRPGMAPEARKEAVAAASGERHAAPSGGHLAGVGRPADRQLRRTPAGWRSGPEWMRQGHAR